MSFARIWALRVPIASAAILAGLPWLAFRGALRPALSGLFDPVDEKALSLMTAVALFNAWTIAHLVHLILAYGRERMALPGASAGPFRIPLSTWLVSSLLMAPVVWRVVTYSHQASQHRIAAMLLYAAAGAVAAVLLLMITLAASAWFERWTRRRRGHEAFPALVR